MTRHDPAMMLSSPRTPVEIIRSKRRRKTVSARMIEGTITVRAPADLDDAELERHVRELVGMIERRLCRNDAELVERAKRVARRHGLPAPVSIRFVSNQDQRWGSCTPLTGEIRITDRLAGTPGWVLDHVVLHELAHLVEPGHGPRFQAIADRGATAERAEGFLLGLNHAQHAMRPHDDRAR